MSLALQPVPTALFAPRDPVRQMMGDANLFSSLLTQNAHRQALQEQAKLIPYQQQMMSMKLANPAMSISGGIGQALELEAVKNQYGENSPQYQNALSAFNANVQSQTSRANYYDQLGQRSGSRYIGNTGRMQRQTALNQLGYPVGVQATMTDQQMANAIANQIPYNAQGGVNNQLLSNLATQEGQQGKSVLFKMTTGVDQQKKLSAANRAMSALNRMEQLLEQASQYSGIAGRSKKLAAQLAQSNDPRWLAYNKYKTDALAAQEDAQIGLGASATDLSRKGFDEIFNIDNLGLSPKAARAKFEELKKLLAMEGQRNTENIAQQISNLKGFNQNVNNSPLQSLSPSGSSNPSFDNKLNWQRWLRSLSPSQRDKVLY